MNKLLAFVAGMSLGALGLAMLVAFQLDRRYL